MARVTKIESEAGAFALDMGNCLIKAERIVCPGCGRFLGYQAIAWGAIKLKCTNSKCRQWVTIDVSPHKNDAPVIAAEVDKICEQDLTSLAPA